MCRTPCLPCRNLARLASEKEVSDARSIYRLNRRSCVSNRDRVVPAGGRSRPSPFFGLEGPSYIRRPTGPARYLDERNHYAVRASQRAGREKVFYGTATVGIGTARVERREQRSTRRNPETHGTRGS